MSDGLRQPRTQAYLLLLHEGALLLLPEVEETGAVEAVEQGHGVERTQRRVSPDRVPNDRVDVPRPVEQVEDADLVVAQVHVLLGAPPDEDEASVGVPSSRQALDQPRARLARQGGFCVLFHALPALQRGDSPRPPILAQVPLPQRLLRARISP